MVSTTNILLLMSMIIMGALAEDDVMPWKISTIVLAVVLVLAVAIGVIAGFYYLLSYITPDY